MRSLKTKVIGTLRALVSVYGLIFALIGLFIVSATVGTGLAPLDSTTAKILSEVEDETSGINQTEVEQEFLTLLNQERQERGLQPVSQRDLLTEMGEEHSSVMAEEGSIGHVEPNGDNIEDRYRERGLLPECRLPIEGTDRYYAGAENAAQSWVYTEIERDDGTTDYISSEEGLAEEGESPERFEVRGES